jgi:hypothetical protein
MPIDESEAATTIIAKAQKGMYDTLSRRSESIRLLYERSEFDDVSGEALAKTIRQAVKGDREKMRAFDISPDEENSLVVDVWEDTVGAAASLMGDDEEAICKIAEGRRIIDGFDIADSETTSFWGTNRVTAASYLSWSMLDTMASFAYEGSCVSFSLKFGDETLQICVEQAKRLETSILSSNVLTANFMPDLSADFRLSTSPSTVAIFHPGFNNVPNIAYSPGVMAELDVVESTLRAAHPGYGSFDLTLKPEGYRPSTNELIQVENGCFGFMLSDSQALLSTKHGFAKAPISPDQEILTFDISAGSEYSAHTLNFKAR